LLTKLSDFDRFQEKVVINWKYDIEDEDMEEAGEEFAEIFSDLKFNQISYRESI
jgi:hypothetical protein